MVLLLLLSLFLSADLFGATAQTVTPAVSPAAGIPECPELSLFMAQDDWLERLVNPVYTTIEEVDRAAAERRRMLECLDSVGRRALLSDRTRTVRYHLALFLSFADGGTDFSPELVDLSATPDPAVRRLREDLGLAPPRGVILVRFFTDPQQMPDHVRDAFENPQTQAVTLWCRYVAVLTSTRRNLSKIPTATEGLGSTFSHELVHAFLNARLGSGIIDNGFPSWFHEGMAIHFSGSGRGHVMLDPSTGGFVRTEPTAQYERYERTFLYLESNLGQAGFNQALRLAVENADPSLLIDAAGEPSHDELVATAELWWRWWPLPVALVRGWALWWLAGFIVMSIVAAWSLWKRWQPVVPRSALEVGLNSDLFAAIQSGDAGAVQYLLRSGADANARDGDGRSALMWAVWLDQSQTAEALVDAGANATREIRGVAELRGCSPDIIRVLADAVARDREEASGD